MSDCSSLPPASSIQTATPAREIVYVLERFIDYEGSDILGVFSSLDAAKAAIPDAVFSEMIYGDGSGGVFWRCGIPPYRKNGPRFGDSLDITPYRIDAGNPVWCVTPTAPPPVKAQLEDSPGQSSDPKTETP